MSNSSENTFISITHVRTSPARVLFWQGKNKEEVFIPAARARRLRNLLVGMGANTDVRATYVVTPAQLERVRAWLAEYSDNAQGE